MESTKNDAAKANVANRPDLDGEEFRDGAFYEPVSERMYFKVLGYCLLGFVVIGIAGRLFSAFVT